MPTSTWEKIATITKTTAGTIDFTSIPSTYTDIMVTGQLRGTGAGAVVNCWYRFNGDSGSTNYIDARAYATSGGAFGNDTTSTGIGENYIGAIHGAGATAGFFTSINLHINGYSNSSIYRHSFLMQTCWGYEAIYRQGVWKNTSAAINQITFLTGASFEVGSTLTLWGIKAA
jgi:hypothetical protein